jgi:protein disulfide-isomerase
MKTIAYGVMALVIGLAQSACAETAWITDYETATAEAAARNVPILVNFTGSDWCGWCTKLESEVFGDATFAQYAQDNLVMLKLDFPRRKPQPDAIKEQNRKLIERYGVQGFPTILLIDASGKEMARTGYQPGGAKAYIEHIKSLVPENDAG